MELKTDAILRGPVWDETIDKLKGVVFDTIWDIYALSISIGMMYDCQIESEDMVPEGYDAEPRSVPRTVLGHTQNKALLEFMLQAALVTTKHLDIDENTRLELAFNDEKKLDFNPIAFIAGTEGVELLEAITTFLNSTYESGVDVIDNDFEIEIEDDD